MEQSTKLYCTLLSPQEEVAIQCLCPMILWQPRRRPHSEREPRMSLSSFRSTATLCGGEYTLSLWLQKGKVICMKWVANEVCLFYVSVALFTSFGRHHSNQTSVSSFFSFVFNYCLISFYRDRKTVEMDFPAIANCFGYTLLQWLLSYTEEAQEHMLELGNITVLMNVKKKKYVQWNTKEWVELLHYTYLYIIT